MAHVVDQTTSRPDVVAWGMAHISTASTPTAKSSGGNHVIDGTAAPRPQGGPLAGATTAADADGITVMRSARKPNLCGTLNLPVNAVLEFAELDS